MFGLICIYLATLTFLNLGFVKKQAILGTKKNQNNLKIKVNFNEGPNKEDFFLNNDIEHYTQVTSFNELESTWIGTYELTPKSIFWTNPNSKKTTLTYFGPYNIRFNFGAPAINRNSSLEIIQEGTEYKNVKLQLANNKQVNYWADVISKRWIEVVRGKIFKRNDNELLCVFQTTVYENKVPIYAFNGEVILTRRRL